MLSLIIDDSTTPLSINRISEVISKYPDMQLNTIRISIDNASENININQLNEIFTLDINSLTITDSESTDTQPMLIDDISVKRININKSILLSSGTRYDVEIERE